MIEFLREYWWLLFGAVWPIFWTLMQATFARKTDLVETNKRITTLEGIVAHLATARDVGEVKNDLTKLSGSVATLDATLKSIQNTTDKLLVIELAREKKS